jgi:hypothetical protein
MTVAELIARLSQLEPSLPVVIPGAGLEADNEVQPRELSERLLVREGRPGIYRDIHAALYDLERDGERIRVAYLR